MFISNKLATLNKTMHRHDLKHCDSTLKNQIHTILCLQLCKRPPDYLVSCPKLQDMDRKASVCTKKWWIMSAESMIF